VRRTPYINYPASRGNLWVGSCVDLLRCFRLACRSLVFALRVSPRRGAFRRMEGAPFIAVGAAIAGALPRHARGKGGAHPVGSKHSASRLAILEAPTTPLDPSLGAIMSIASLFAFLLALAICVVSARTAQRRGPFTWLLGRLGPDALHFSGYIARLLGITAAGLIVFATLLVFFPQRVAALSHWGTLAFAVIPFMLASLWSPIRHRAP
jgi:hypothetical protein